MMVYDCFPFFNEVDILKIRLNILNSYVDRFVIEESTVTFSGEPKELCFEKHKHLFEPFLHKIDYIVVDNSPIDVTTHERDKFQKNQLLKGLKDIKEDDVIILSDVDEIPDPEKLRDVIAHIQKEKIYHFAQRMFYCYMNMEEVSGNLLSITGEFPGVKRRKWLGSKVFCKESIPETGIIDIREISPADGRSVRIDYGGWHFGYMGGYGEKDASKRIGVKVAAAAHQEYNSEDTLAEAVDKLICGGDIFGRDAEFIWVEIDDSYPVYIREHKDEYKHLIMPQFRAGYAIYRSAAMRIRRYQRKIARKIRRWFS